MGTGTYDRRGGARSGTRPGRWPWALTATLCAVGVALATPEWVPKRWSREDGPIEYATFACFVVSSALAFWTSARLRASRRRVLAVAALGLVLFVAAGEEVSWGQRWFGIETPEVLVDGNRQNELNLHNIDGLQEKAVIAQLGVAGAGVVLAMRSPRRWARAGAPFFAGYLAYRAGRGAAAVLGWSPSDRNSEAAELVLALGLLALTIGLVAEWRSLALAPEETARGDLPRFGGALRSPRPSGAPRRPPAARPMSPAHRPDGGAR